MGLHIRLLLLSGALVSAVLHQPVSRDGLYPSVSSFIHSRRLAGAAETGLQQDYPLIHHSLKLQKRGNCISQNCKGGSSHPQPQPQRSTGQQQASSSREPRPGDSMPYEPRRSRSDSPANSSPRTSVESRRAATNNVNTSNRDQAEPFRAPLMLANRQRSSYPGERLGRALPTEDFGTRLRREREKKDLVQSAMYPEGPTDGTPLSSQRPSIDAPSQVSSMGAESIAPKSGGPTHSNS